MRSHPFLWKVEGGPHPSWLFGTIHSDDPTVSSIPATVTSALDGSQSFHPEIELSPDVAPALMTKLFRPDGPGLSAQLPPALWERTKKAGATLGLPDMILDRLTPGTAALILSEPPPSDTDAIVDIQLYNRAKAHHLTVAALESLEEQLAIFEKLTSTQSIAALKEALDEAEAGHPSEKKLFAAYASGDEQAIVKAVEEEFDSSLESRALAGPLLYDRNVTMTSRLLAHLKTGGAFVAIGVGHLTGPKSVVALLRAKGWKITRVAVAAGVEAGGAMVK